MTGKRFTNFYEDTLIAPTDVKFVLADVPAQYVPTTLSAIETRKYKSFWLTTDDWHTALDYLTLFQERLLMDATDRIVSEVRALRDGAFTPEDARDPEIDPYTLPLTSLRTIAASVDDTNADISAILANTNQTLQDILTAVQAQGGGEGVIERLDTLILLLGAL